VTNDTLRGQGWIGLQQGGNERRKFAVLGVLVMFVVDALELYSDRIIVAGMSSFETGFPGMPRASMYGDILYKLSVPPDNEVCRYTQAYYFRKILVLILREAIGKELVDVRPAKLSGGQADAMNNDEVRLTAIGSIVAVW
jgi:hypothetical protein